MKRVVIAPLFLVVLAGCGPRTARQTSQVPLPEEAHKAIIADDLEVDVNDKTMVLSWRRSGQGAISGYNIYVSERPLSTSHPGEYIDSDIAPFNSVPFPGDTEPEDGVEHFEATGLDNGIRYFVTVRVVYPDGSLSRPSNEMSVICGPRGEIELPIRYQASPDGYSFEHNAYTSANSPDNDLYFYSKDGYDYLASPRRLDGFINDTRLVVLPLRGSFDKVAAYAATSAPTASGDQVKIVSGDWILARCERGTSALMEVRDLRGTGEDRRVVLFFAYSAIVGEVVF